MEALQNSLKTIEKSKFDWSVNSSRELILLLSIIRLFQRRMLWLKVARVVKAAAVAAKVVGVVPPAIPVRAVIGRPQQATLLAVGGETHHPKEVNNTCRFADMGMTIVQ